MRLRTGVRGGLVAVAGLAVVLAGPVTVPAAADPTSFITAMQKSGADAFGAYDQYTWSIGTAYALTPTSKLKAEWSQTHVGAASSLVDTPAGERASHQRFNVLSLSYSFVF